MLLLSWPSLNSMINWRRPAGTGAVRATARLSKTALLPEATTEASAESVADDGSAKSIEPPDAHVERDDAQFIVSAEVGSQLLQRSPQLVEDRSGHARTDIEDDRDVDRQLLVGDVTDLLRHAVVEQLEIGRRQADDRPPLTAYGSLHGDDVGAGTKHRGRILWRGSLAGAERCRGEPGRRHGERGSEDQRTVESTVHRASSRSLSSSAG